MDNKQVNLHATPLAENFRYVLSVMAWLTVFFIGFIFFLLIIISVLPDDPEWVEYCTEYYPELSISSCRSTSGGV